jgi:isopentenyl-diphosphate delta-isomerase
VAAIDVAGAGGTSWSQVEMHRAPDDSARRIARAFEDWGIPTADSIRQVRCGAPDTLLIASGGLRDGVEVAKALALGAHVAGIALPLLRQAVVSEEAVVGWLEEIIQELRIAMFCAGCGRLEDLRGLCA